VLRAHSNITAKAKAADDSPDFSTLIRKNLQGTHDAVKRSTVSSR
jgi:hypothetical protein